VPGELQEVVRQYYNYYYKGSKAHTAAAPFLDILPSSLRSKLNLAIKRPLVEKLDVFKSCSMATIVAVIKKLEHVVSMPQELLIRQGNIGDRMFFVDAGFVDVYVETHNSDGRIETQWVAERGPGEHFGEAALQPHGTRVRNASVECRTFCELEVLTRESYYKLLDKHEDLSQNIRVHSTSVEIRQK
jgi:CRP-like cAMP-binding protein